MPDTILESEITFENKKTYRTEMESLRVSMENKPKKYMAYFHIRDNYYRGISVGSKKDVENHVTTTDKIKYVELENQTSIGLEGK